MKEDDEKKKFNDVWVYDTLTSRWHEIQAPMKL
jgi:Kelch motif